MEAVGLGYELFRKPEQRVAFSKLYARFEHCAQDWGQTDFGLQLAPYQQIDILGPVALVTRMECDVRSAMAAILKNLVIHTNATIVGMHEEADTATLTIDAEPVPGGARQYVLLATGVARNVQEQAAKRPIDLIEVSFRGEVDGGHR